MRDTRLSDLPGEPLGDFGGFGDAAPFRDQAGHVDARGEKPALGEFSDVGGGSWLRSLGGFLRLQVEHGPVMVPL